MTAGPQGLTGLARWRAGVCAGLVCVGLLSGCATAQNPDPLEAMNRKVFAFNEAVDKAVLKPVATRYQNNVPEPLRAMATSFFGNLKDAWSTINLVLQGRPGDAVLEGFRFVTNTLVGLGGLVDIATPLGMERFGEDFGQTLGKWGMGPGAYVVLPILGPSSGRDLIGLPVELSATPTTFVNDTASKTALSALNVVNTRAGLLGATKLIDEVALDKYNFVRDGYLQRRRNQVYDGNPPEEPDPESSAASAPK